MKATGIVRNTDKLGRIVIPMELRRMLNIKENDGMEIFVEDESIILKKYSPHGACQITGEVSSENVTLAGGKIVLSPTGVDEVLKELETYLCKGVKK